MKKLIQLSAALFVSLVITACGGGGTDTAGNNNPPPSVEAGKLIIDNGRGTTNNQDTERAK